MVKRINVPYEEGLDLFNNPTSETIFQLRVYQAPPEDYADFLIKTVGIFTETLKQHHGVIDINDICEKSVEKLAEANPEAEEEDIQLFRTLSRPINLYFRARLRFLKPEISDRVLCKVYQSREYVQDFFNPYVHGDYISFENFREEIPSRLKSLRTALSKWYPNGTIPAGNLMLIAKEEDDIHKFVNGFRFTLCLESIPTNHLETYATLRDYGSVYCDGKMDNGICIPAISIKAKTTGGKLELPRKIVKALGEIVQEQYKELGDIEHRQSYIEHHHR